MNKIYALKDSQGHIQPTEEKCIVLDGEGDTALSCYKDNQGIEKNITKLVKQSRKGPYVIISGQRYYIELEVVS